MFNKDGIFGRKDEDARNDPRPVNVNVTPALHSGTPARQQPAQPDTFRLDRAYAGEPQAPQPQPQEEPAGSKLIVGPHIKLKGVEITDCDTLVVEGRVEASMDSRVVQIAEGGVFSGTATMDVAEIRGTFQGELTVRKQLMIYASGRVSGEIRYGKIEIEEGGELSGKISTLADAKPDAKAEAPAPAASPSKATPTVPASPSPARPGAAASR